LLPRIAELSIISFENMNYFLIVYFSAWFVIKMITIGEEVTLSVSSYIVGAHELKDKFTRLIVCIVYNIFCSASTNDSWDCRLERVKTSILVTGNRDDYVYL